MKLNKKRLLRTMLLIIIIFSSAYGVLFSLRFAMGTEYPVVVVRGKSMVPTYRDGDLLIVRGIADINQIDLQDIIVFHSPYNWETLIVHRVVHIDSNDGETFFSTKGDNNSARDPWRLKSEDVVGEVLQKIPYMGGLVNAIQSPYGIGLLYSLIVIVVVVELFYEKGKK